MGTTNSTAESADTFAAETDALAESVESMMESLLTNRDGVIASASDRTVGILAILNSNCTEIARGEKPSHGIRLATGERIARPKCGDMAMIAAEVAAKVVADLDVRGIVATLDSKSATALLDVLSTVATLCAIGSASACETSAKADVKADKARVSAANWSKFSGDLSEGVKPVLKSFGAIAKK